MIFPRSTRFFALLLALSSSLWAEGMMPATSKDHPASRAPNGSLLVGDLLSSDVTVIDSNGKPRSLLSFKTPIDLLVLEFVSPECSYNQAAWIELRRFYDKYKDWHAVFIAVSSRNGESLETLKGVMAQAGLPFEVVSDPGGKVAALVHATATPEIVIVDEWGRLKYRGALHDQIEHPQERPHQRLASDALAILIGHVDPLPNAEPDAFIGCPLNP